MDIKIVGIGPGNIDYILPIAIYTIQESDLILGFKRALQSIEHMKITAIELKSLSHIKEIINKNANKKISILASGDPCFYGILEYVKNNIEKNIKVIPGMSSFQYLMAKLGKSWSGSYIGSLHGRDEKLENIVLNNTISIWLTDTKKNPKYIIEKLLNINFKGQVYVGENLSYRDEKITIGTPSELLNKKWEALSVVVIENTI